ncbi:MAG: cation-translocating P-type ATPase, partial [Anaerolineae bacterium]|nr:cation-translocating P-type ATPase [Anaerolineae bacterium]
GTDLSIITSNGLGAYFQAMQQEIMDLFIIAVSLAIAAVPEGLAAVVTICLALGMREMVKRHALIRRLPAVETLGSANVICSDKTGTLTQNEMMAVRLYVANYRLDVTGQGYSPEGEFNHYGTPAVPQENAEIMSLLRGGLLSSDAQLEAIDTDSGGTGFRMIGDPTEGAFVVAAAKAGLWREETEQIYPRLAEVPFDSTRKRMSTIHRRSSEEIKQDGGLEYIAYVKGAPDVVLGLCNTILEEGKLIELTAARREHIQNMIRDLASDGLRVLAVTCRLLDKIPDKPTSDEIERDLVLVGLIAMTDPARPEVAPAIAKAKHAGIRTVMITGDYPETARAIAQEIGLIRTNGQVVTGAELNEMSDECLDERIEDIDVFARVSPEHKVRIVEALKDRGYVVAMTGDGVNDAPALKRASIGIAMGITGTDVSKETADMVLTDDNYASIVSAVEQGRIIYSNIRKFVYFLLSCNMAEIMVIFLATMFGGGSPLTALQLLWLNLLTDGAPALALGLEKGDPDIMDQPPRPVREPIINRMMLVGIIVQTIAITSAVLTAYYTGLRWYPSDPSWAQTMAFITLSASELVRAYTSRSERASLFRIGVFSNKYMQYAVALSFALLLAAIYIPFLQSIFSTQPLGLHEWTLILPLLLVPSIAAEVTKAVIRLTDRRRAAAATA